MPSLTLFLTFSTFIRLLRRLQPSSADVFLCVRGVNGQRRTLMLLHEKKKVKKKKKRGVGRISAFVKSVKKSRRGARMASERRWSHCAPSPARTTAPGKLSDWGRISIYGNDRRRRRRRGAPEINQLQTLRTPHPAHTTTTTTLPLTHAPLHTFISSSFSQAAAFVAACLNFTNPCVKKRGCKPTHNRRCFQKRELKKQLQIRSRRSGWGPPDFFCLFVCFLIKGSDLRYVINASS